MPRSRPDESKCRGARSKHQQVGGIEVIPEPGHATGVVWSANGKRDAEPPAEGTTDPEDS